MKKVSVVGAGAIGTSLVTYLAQDVEAGKPLEIDGLLTRVFAAGRGLYQP